MLIRPRGAGAVSGETRQRILDVALDLFVEQGYEKTSLREIAERVGVTKAALYYHFQSKEDIVTTLHMPVHELMHSAMARLGDTTGTASWLAFLDWLIDQLAAHSRLFLMYQRNATGHRRAAPQGPRGAGGGARAALPRSGSPTRRSASTSGSGWPGRWPWSSPARPWRCSRAPPPRIRPSSPPRLRVAVRDLLRVGQPSA